MEESSRRGRGKKKRKKKQKESARRRYRRKGKRRRCRRGRPSRWRGTKRERRSMFRGRCIASEGGEGAKSRARKRDEAGPEPDRCTRPWDARVPIITPVPRYKSRLRYARAAELCHMFGEETYVGNISGRGQSRDLWKAGGTESRETQAFLRILVFFFARAVVSASWIVSRAVDSAESNVASRWRISHVCTCARWRKLRKRAPFELH